MNTLSACIAPQVHYTTSRLNISFTMESSVKSKIGKIDQFLSSDAKLLKISEEVLVLLKEEKLKKKKIFLKKQLNQAIGITIPVKRKNMKLPKRKIVLPKVSHNFLNIAWGFHAWHVYQVH